MDYNVIHREYRLGLDLYFKLVNAHAEYPGKWVCTSNVPRINIKVMDVKTESEAVQIIQSILESEIKISTLQGQQEVVSGYYSKFSINAMDQDRILEFIEKDINTIKERRKQITEIHQSYEKS